MRTAETSLAIIRDRGKRGLPLEDVYRQLFNPDLYLRAYGQDLPERGAMTQGHDRGDRGRDVPGEDRGHHRGSSATSGIGGRRSGATYIAKKQLDEAASARASRPGRTSCCKR